jgi:TubC N-terminal docking domain
MSAAASALLADLRAHDIRLVRDGDRLTVDAPRGTVTPELLEALRLAKTELLELLRMDAPDPEANALNGGAASCRAVRIYSKVLDAELWIAPDEEAARRLEEELRTEGSSLAVVTAAEALVLGKMAEADAREVFRALAKIQHVMPGARLREVIEPDVH